MIATMTATFGIKKLKIDAPLRSRLVKLGKPSPGASIATVSSDILQAKIKIVNVKKNRSIPK